MNIAIIMHGISGSGKSTTARDLANNYKRSYKTNPQSRYDEGFSSIIHSTDSYFMVDGKYLFDRDKLREFHVKNFYSFSNSLKRKVNVIIVDNTNLVPDHWIPYVDIACACGYDIEHVWIPLISAEVAFERNLHNVPLAVIESQIENYNKYFPI